MQGCKSLLLGSYISSVCPSVPVIMIFERAHQRIVEKYRWGHWILHFSNVVPKLVWTVPRFGILERLLKGISTGVLNSRLLVQLFVHYHFLGKLNNIDSLLGTSPIPHHFSNSKVQAISTFVASSLLCPCRHFSDCTRRACNRLHYIYNIFRRFAKVGL